MMGRETPLNMMRPPAKRLRRPTGDRRRRWPLLAPAVILIAVAIVWSGLWYYAASVASRTLAGWVEREAAAGRTYSCGAQSIGGFPFAIKAQCTEATAQITHINPPYTVEAKAITFAAEMWQPMKLIGDISGPLTVAETGHAPSWAANWLHARIDVSGRPANPESCSVQLEQPRFDRALGRGSTASVTIFKADRADLRARIVGGAPDNHPVIEVALKLAGATAPWAHHALAEGLDVQFDAVVRGLKDLSPKSWAERVRELEAADGGIDVKSLRIAGSNIIVAGAGTLKVNGHGKLDGVLRVAIVGLDRLVPLLGVDRLIAQSIEALAGSSGLTAQGASALDSLIPGLGQALRQSANESMIENLKKMGEPTTVDKQPATILPLRFADGAVYLGMLRLGEVPPLL